jgi:hypothetical protein
MYYIITTLDVITNTVSISKYFIEPLPAVNHLSVVSQDLSSSLSKDPVYGKGEITTLQITKDRFEIYVKEFGWIANSRILKNVIQLIEVPETIDEDFE